MSLSNMACWTWPWQPLDLVTEQPGWKPLLFFDGAFQEKVRNLANFSWVVGSENGWLYHSKMPSSCHHVWITNFDWRQSFHSVSLRFVSKSVWKFWSNQTSLQKRKGLSTNFNPTSLVPTAGDFESLTFSLWFGDDGHSAVNSSHRHSMRAWQWNWTCCQDKLWYYKSPHSCAEKFRLRERPNTKILKPFFTV